jgi:hypothetical protein
LLGLDLSHAGNQALEAALQEYDLQMDAMEERLARLLRDKLTACQDAEDMFRVFARFNLLLTRTRVRAAVKEFQMQLINTVATAIGRLQSKFTLKYESSAAARISRLRGIPPVAGKIVSKNVLNLYLCDTKYLIEMSSFRKLYINVALGQTNGTASAYAYGTYGQRPRS